MTNRLKWDSRYSTGNETIDDQHLSILALCNTLADCLNDAGHRRSRMFDDLLETLMALAREHFATEAHLLETCSCPEIENHRCEQEEFDFLTTEIITTENFDRTELQTFLALWWSGHVIGTANTFRTTPELQPGTGVCAG